MTHSATEWRYRILTTPTGPFVLAVSDTGELRTGWTGNAWSDDPETDTEWLYLLPGELVRDDSAAPKVAQKLERFFEGKAVSFDDIPTPAGSPFQHACWEVCRAIPRGQVITYGELALRAGSSTNAARAAGQTMRRNLLPIIVPCHRVVGSNGLHGFGGSDDPASENLSVKRWLLSMEGAAIAGSTSTDQPEFASLTGR